MQKHYWFFVFLFLSSIALIECASKKGKQVPTGENLAHTWCGSCHDLPQPGLLDKNSWRTGVLPVMAGKLGVDYIYETSLGDPAKMAITVAEFNKIAEWYIQNAPDSMPLQDRPAVKEITE